MKENTWDEKAQQIRQLCDQHGMEVYTKLIRRLIQGNSAIVFPTKSNDSHKSTENPPNYRLLQEEIQRATEDTDHARNIAEAIGGSDSDGFKDFDLVSFMKHFNMDALSRSIFALGFKNSPKGDLRTKAHEIITSAFPTMLEILQNPAKHSDLEPHLIAKFLQDYFSDPLPSFLDNEAKLSLSYAARVRYPEDQVPPEIIQITESIERLRAEESLLKLFVSAGPESTRSVSTVSEVLKAKWKVKLHEQEIAEIFSYVASSESGAWNLTVFVEAIQNGHLDEEFDWNQVIKSLDRDDFIIHQPKGLTVLLDAFREVSKTFPQVEVFRLWSRQWEHPDGLLSVLKALMSREFERFDVSLIPSDRRIVSPELVSEAPASVKALASTYENLPMNNVDAVQSLLYLTTDPDLTPEIKIEATALIERQWKLTPELLLVGGFQAPRPDSEDYNIIVNRLFSAFYAGHPSRHLVFYLLWKIDSLGVVQRFNNLYQLGHTNLENIVEITDQLGVTLDLSRAATPEMAIDVACLGSRRGSINLERWLDEMSAAHGRKFVESILMFLESRSTADYEFASGEQKKPKIYVTLRAAEVSTLLQVFDRSNDTLSPEHPEFLVSVQRKCIQSYPRLINLHQGHDDVILGFNTDTNTFPPSVDKRMQDYYKDMYSHDISITSMVKDLRQFKDSNLPEEQDLFACMIHSLFDEYSCYPSYPTEPLSLTSVLFGSLIEFRLLDGLALNVALGMVLDAVKDHDPKDNMFKFGLQALRCFSSRLREWKGYCAHLTQISGMQGTDMMEIAMEVAMQSDNNGTITNGDGKGSPYLEDISPFLTNGNLDEAQFQSPPVQVFKSLRLDSPTKDKNAFTEPDEDIRDKVLFIVNNLTASNLNSKLGELQDYLLDNYHQWFADYLVVERARTEPNNHKLYQDFLDGFNSKNLLSEVLYESYRNAFNLLNNENTINSNTERQYLKYLGAWLGGLTIAKDKPIKHKNIAFKELLIEGYDTERLVVVLPFTCKILEQATKSTVFKPPNPWLMAIIRLLAELYHHADLKLNLKFEIEVLCKNLGLDIKDIEASTELRDRPQQEDATGEMLQDGMNDLSLLNYPRDDSARPERFSESAINSIVPQLNGQVVFSSSLSVFSQLPGLKRTMQTAIDLAIREIISPVVERSVTIASISTTQLILKDFAMEPSEEKMIKASHKMVQTMAGSLALVTCKEPLRMSMSNHIRQALLQNGYSEQVLNDQAILLFVNDNLELASSIIEKAAQEKSIPEIDENLAQAYAQRRLFRERRPTTQFMDPAMSRYVMSLPDPFRLKPGGLAQNQLNVYEDFARMPRLSSEVSSNARVSQEALLNDFMPLGQSADSQSNVPQMPSSRPLPQQPQRQTAQQQQQQQPQRQLLPPPTSIVARPPQTQAEQIKATKERIYDMILEIERSVKETSDSSSDISEGDQTNVLINEIVRTAAQSPWRDVVSAGAAQTICGLLFTSQKQPHELECFVALLGKLCNLSTSTAQEVMTWLVSQNDERMFNVPVTVMLVKSNLLSLKLLDITISRSIETMKSKAIEFLSKLIRETVLGPSPIALRSDFVSSLEKLTEYLNEDPQNRAAKRLLEDLQKFDSPPPMIEEAPEVLQRNQMAYIFEEWVQLCGHPSTNEKSFVAFIAQMYHEQILVQPTLSTMFFKTSIEICLELYARDIARTENPLLNDFYGPTDALATLIILLTKYYLRGENNTADKSAYFGNLLSVLVLVFNSQNERSKELFNQKIFFRLFSSLLCEYHAVEKQLQVFNEPIMNSFLQTFLAIQPRNYPAFAFAWTGLVAHRLFMPKIIQYKNEQGLCSYMPVLNVLLRYLGNLLQNPEFNMDVVRQYYKGILRIVIVLHHDFPDFVAEHHRLICDAVPASCTQIRNLVLSAFPSSINDLPDPFTQGLKIDRLSEMAVSPPIAGDVAASIPDDLRHTIDECLAGETTSDSLDNIMDALKTEYREELGLSFTSVFTNVELINAMVLYIAMDAISNAEKSGEPAFQAKSPHAELLLHLTVNLGPEARYFFLSAITNQLRYPNAHTHYFSCTLLSLFGHAAQDSNGMAIRSQITRVLLERLIVHKPHPWGLIITLLELLKNPAYDFWNLSFIKSTPEIQRLFEALFQHVKQQPARVMF